MGKIEPKEIELHVGHYGDRTGANRLIDEVQYARKFIKRIYQILTANKVPATYYEDNVSKNQTQNINNLIRHHNADTNGFIVSGHLNASSGVVNSSIGAEVLYYDQSAVAQKVVNAICGASGITNRGIKRRTDLGILVRTYEPAILIEFGFVNSRKDVELMDKHFESICQAVAKELAAVIGYTIKNQKEEPAVVTKKNSLTTTGIKDAKELFKYAYDHKVFSVDHSKDIEKMSDGEIVSLTVAFVNRTKSR